MRPDNRSLVGVVLATSLFACGPQRRGELVGAPVTPDTVAEHRGERLFFQHCSKCHPGGEAGLGPALNDKPLPEIAIETQIRKGVGAMPAFSAHHLKDEEVEAITKFVVELRETRPTKSHPVERPRETHETSTSRR
jgi:mono/diheme cytochrome c family protein